MKTKCVLFDADGVVINSDFFSVQYQKQFNISNDEMLPFFMGEFQDCLTGKSDLKEVIQSYLKKWKWTGTVDEFLQFWFESEHHVDDRVVELIEELKEKNIKCYLATKQEKYRTAYIKNEMGFNKVFDHIFSSAEIGYKKPDQRFFEVVYDWIEKNDGFTKKELFFVDDGQENVDSAIAYGIDSHFYTNFDNFEKSVKKFIV